MASIGGLAPSKSFDSISQKFIKVMKMLILIFQIWTMIIIGRWSQQAKFLQIIT